MVARSPDRSHGKSMSSSIERLPSCRKSSYSLLRVIRRMWRPLNTDPPEVFEANLDSPDTPIQVVRFAPAACSSIWQLLLACGGTLYNLDRVSGLSRWPRIPPEIGVNGRHIRRMTT